MYYSGLVTCTIHNCRKHKKCIEQIVEEHLHEMLFHYIFLFIDFPTSQVEIEPTKLKVSGASKEYLKNS